jgi:GNAT superfamily N-acetyltransferase
MAEPFEPVRLQPSQVDEAAAMLGRAFMSDPPLIYGIPDPTERARMLPALFRANLRCALAIGEVWTTPGSVRGVAMWLPPEHPIATDEDMERAGVSEMIEAWGPENMARVQRIGSAVEKAHQAALDGPTWSLFFLGVEPENQGKGIGHALVRLIYPRADTAGAACYLDTFEPRNPAKYRRMGFVHVDEAVVPDTDLRLWVMKRYPAT